MLYPQPGTVSVAPRSRDQLPQGTLVVWKIASVQHLDRGGVVPVEGKSAPISPSDTRFAMALLSPREFLHSFVPRLSLVLARASNSGIAEPERQ
jgi:hypothetical protein